MFAHKPLIPLGVLAAVMAALLFAPQSGRMTRSILQSKGAALKEKLIEDASLTKMQVQNQVNHTNRIARIRAYELGNQLQNAIESKQTALKDAVSELPIPILNGHSR